MIAVAARQIPIRLYAWLVGDWAAGAAALALPGAVVTGALAVADQGGGPPRHRGRDRSRPGRRLPGRRRHAQLRRGLPGRPPRDQPAADRRHRARRGRAGPGRAARAGRDPRPTSGSARCCWSRPGCCSSPSRSTTAGAATGCSTAPTSPPRPPPSAICGALARVAALAFPSAPLAVAGVMVLIVSFGVAAAARGLAARPGPRPRRGRRRGRRDRRLAGAGRRRSGTWRFPARLWDADLSHYPTHPAGRRLAGAVRPGRGRVRGRHRGAPAVVVRHLGAARRARRDRRPGRARAALVVAAAGRRRGRARRTRWPRWPPPTRGPPCPGPPRPPPCCCTRSAPAWSARGRPASACCWWSAIGLLVAALARTPVAVHRRPS